MSEVEIEAKSKEEAIRKVKEILNANDSEFIYHITEIKGKLFKGTSYKIKAITLQALTEHVMEFLEKITKNLGLHPTIEAKVNDHKIEVQMSSENNKILIGKNGQTLKALETLAKQFIFNNYKYYVSIYIDVENYREKRIKNIEYLAKKTAKEVMATNIEVKLENMNSFERRIVHNALTNFKGVTTISEGEDPNRHVIIKPIEK